MAVTSRRDVAVPRLRRDKLRTPDLVTSQRDDPAGRLYIQIASGPSARSRRYARPIGPERVEMATPSRHRPDRGQLVDDEGADRSIATHGVDAQAMLISGKITPSGSAT